MSEVYMSQICGDAINRICLEKVMRVQGRDYRVLQIRKCQQNLLYWQLKPGN